MLTDQDYFQACIEGDVDTVTSYLNSNPDALEITTEQGWTALILSSYNKRYDVAHILIEKGANVNASNRKGTTVLMYAKTRVEHKKEEMDYLDFLISKGAHVNATDIFGKTVLDYIVETNRPELAEWFESRGAKHSNQS